MKNVNLNFKSKKWFGEAISLILQPLIITIPVFIIASYFTVSGSSFYILTFLCLIFATFLPFITTVMWIKKNNLDLDISDKNHRKIPLLLGTTFYLIGTAVLFVLGAPTVITVLMFCYFSNTLLSLIITIFWKISIHSMGIAGPTAAMTYILGYPGLLFGIPLIMVMWSRIYLKKHTKAQVVIGAVTSFIFTWLQFKILVP